jgi:hypothetical protein
MQNIILKITQIDGNSAEIVLEGNFSLLFLRQTLTGLLMQNPDYIPVFLDATGAALIGNPLPELTDGEILKIKSFNHSIPQA